MFILRDLAAASGGKAFQVQVNPNGRSSIDDALDEIAAELRSQYAIGYRPDHAPNDGKLHMVSVRTANPDYQVRARKEYWGH